MSTLPRPTLVRIGRCAVVDVESLRFDASGLNELDLLLFAVEQGRGPFQRVKVVFVERLFSNRRSGAATSKGSAPSRLAGENRQRSESC